MIHGIGTDIVRVDRIQAALDRNGARFAARILAPCERADFEVSRDQVRFLAKRFAAKEAFGKALGTGVAAPATLHAVSVGHDERGKPLYEFGEALDDYMRERGLDAHLSLSDEADYVLAFAVIERR